MIYNGFVDVEKTGPKRFARIIEEKKKLKENSVYPKHKNIRIFVSELIGQKDIIPRSTVLKDVSLLNDSDLTILVKKALDFENLQAHEADPLKLAQFVTIQSGLKSEELSSNRIHEILDKILETIRPNLTGFEDKLPENPYTPNNPLSSFEWFKKTQINGDFELI